MTQPVPILAKPRDPAWIANVMQAGPNGKRFDQADSPYRGQALPSGLVTMYDSVSVPSLPTGALAYAGYDYGTFDNIAALQARFPDAAIVSITPDGSHPAMYVDVEPGDARPSDIAAFIRAGGIGFYCSASDLQPCNDALAAAGIDPGSVRKWSAHWIGPHICGPSSCGYPLADGTQYLSTSGWDESIVRGPAFFQQVPPPAPVPVVIPAWQRAIFARMPVVRVGSIDVRDNWVQQVQRLASVAGPVPCLPDGIFGPNTLASVEAAQTAYHVPLSGVVDGPTWTALAAGGTSAVLPVVRAGSTNAVMVKRVQALCNVVGRNIATDGSFGPVTLGAVQWVQRQYLPYDQVDGVVGPVTWALLLTRQHP